MIKRLIIAGGGGAGKDFLKTQLENKKFNSSISHTTRPIRLGETEGRDYYYITKEKFQSMIGNNEFREWNKFANKWYYGTSNIQFHSANLFIITPSGIRALTKEERMESFVIYLDIPKHVRRKRLKSRKDSDDPERRLDTDRADFREFDDFDLRVTDPEFNVGDIHAIIEKITDRKAWVS